MKFSAKKYAIGLYEVTRQLSGQQLKMVIKNFVWLLARRQDLSLGPKIIEEFEKYWWQKEGIVSVDLITARPLAREQEKKLVNQLADRLDKKIVANKSVDESLIGGIIIKFADVLVDGSLKNQLNNLKNNLVKE